MYMITSSSVPLNITHFLASNSASPSSNIGEVATIGSRTGFPGYTMERSIWDIQKVQRGLKGARLFLVFSGVIFFYVNLSTRAGVPRKANPYSVYPAGTDLLFDATKLYKSAVGNIFEDEDWGPLDFGIMAKHYERQGKAPYAYHSAYMVHLLSNAKITDPNL